MIGQCRWHRHPNGVNPPRWLRNWLTDRGSLTAKLISHATTFRVQRLSQKRAMSLADEYPVLDLPRSQQVVEREVLLCCDEQAVVFAHTVVSLKANAADWPFFRTLGNRSLGSTLFNDPLVTRSALSYARLTASHALGRRALQHVTEPDNASALFARRSIFRRRHGVMLVTEVFLPAMHALHDNAGDAPSSAVERLNDGCTPNALHSQQTEMNSIK